MGGMRGFPSVKYISQRRHLNERRLGTTSRRAGNEAVSKRQMEAFVHSYRWVAKMNRFVTAEDPASERLRSARSISMTKLRIGCLEIQAKGG